MQLPERVVGVFGMRVGLRKLARISHAPGRNAHRAPKAFGVAPGEPLPRRLAAGDLLTNCKICEKVRLVAGKGSWVGEASSLCFFGRGQSEDASPTHRNPPIRKLPLTNCN